MRLRLVVSTMVAVLSMGVVPLSEASMFGIFGRTETQGAVKARMVKFEVRNDGAEAVTLRNGEDEFRVAPHQAKTVRLPEGSQLTAVTASPNRPSGALVAVITKMLDGNTLVLQ